MAITYPLNLLDDFPGWSTSFELMYRQEQSRHASGRTRVKDFGTPIWSATYTSKNLTPNQTDIWKAKLNLLENGLNTFVAYPFSRYWPINHPNGTIKELQNWVLESGFWDSSKFWIDDIYLTQSNTLTTTALVNTVNLNNKAISLKNILGLTLTIGDYISINDKLYQVMESATSNSSGVTEQFEVRPHLSLTTAVNNEVKIYKPNCLMTLSPGSVSVNTGLNGRGSISFQAIESRG